MISAFPVSKFIMRLMLVLLLIIVYKDLIMTWNFKDIQYLVIFGLTLFSILLFFGGFSKNSSLTIISGILIVLFGILLLLLDIQEQMSVVIATVSIATGFLFITTGNRKANLSR